MNRTRANSNDQFVYPMPVNAGVPGAGGFREAVRDAWRDNAALLKAEQNAAPAPLSRIRAAGDLLLLPMLALAVVFTALVDRGIAARWNEYERETTASYDQGQE